MRHQSERCECADSGCPEQHGAGCEQRATIKLVRIDMSDAGVLMCEACADDALESGVFRVGVRSNII